MTNPPSSIDNALLAVKKKYVEHLEGEVQEMQALIVPLQENSYNEAERKKLVFLAHRYAGSGAMFGFPAISEAGRKLEEAASDMQEASLLLPLLIDLKNICKETFQREQPASEEQHGPAVVAMLERKRSVVLIVDDDALIIELVTQKLAQYNVLVLSAENGQKALDIASVQIPDLIILDGNMPGEDGFAVLKKLKGSAPTQAIPVMMLTARQEEKDIISGLSLGAVDYLIKPFAPNEMIDRIIGLLHCKKKTILIADDDPLTLQLLKYKLEQRGFNVLLATDGVAALEYAQSHTLDLIILDRMMPALDGMAVLQKLKNDGKTKHIPVIMLTALRQGKDIVGGLNMGASDYVVKPFMPEELIARIVHVLDLEVESQKRGIS